MGKRKIFKLVLKGEVVADQLEFEMEDGTIVTLDQLRKIVVPSKKNQQRIAVNRKTLKPILIPSKQHQDWYADHQDDFKDFGDKIALAGYSLPITRCKVTVLYYFPDSKERDLISKTETIMDILTDKGIIMDDNFKIAGHLELKGWVKRQQPRTELYLTLFEAGSDELIWDLTSPEYFDQKRLRRNLLTRIRRQRNKAERALEAVPSTTDL